LRRERRVRRWCAAHLPKPKNATPPASNVPSSGYGKDVDSLVDKSPTMKNDIATLKKRGWTFEEGEAGKGRLPIVKSELLPLIKTSR
jgi:type VI secretion system secreted protein VgrG